MEGNHKEFTVVFWVLRVSLVLLLFSALNKPQLVQSAQEDCTRGFAVWWEEPYVQTSPLAEEWHFLGMRAGSHLLGAARQSSPYKLLWLLICLHLLKFSFNVSWASSWCWLWAPVGWFQGTAVSEPFSQTVVSEEMIRCVHYMVRRDCFSMSCLQEKFTKHRTHNSNWVKNT